MADPEQERASLPSLQAVGLRAVWIVATVAAAYALLLLWNRLELILLPLAIAAVLAALLQPVVDALERRRVPRWAGGVLVPALVLVAVAALVAAIAPSFIVQARGIGRQVGVGLDEVPGLLQSVGIRDAELTRAVDTLVRRFEQEAGAIGARLGSGFLVAAQGVVTVIATLALAAIMLVYLLVDGRGFGQGLVRLVPEPRRARASAGAERAWRATALFTRGQVVVAAVDGVGMGVGLWLVGVPLALPIGVLTFLLAFIPYVGPITAGLLAGLIALSAGGIELMLLAGVVATIVQQLEGNVVYPLVMGKALRLHPLAVLLAVGTGAATIGLAGAFLATPVLAAAAAGFGYLALPSRETRWARRTARGGLLRRGRRRAAGRTEEVPTAAGGDPAADRR